MIPREEGEREIGKKERMEVRGYEGRRTGEKERKEGKKRKGRGRRLSYLIFLSTCLKPGSSGNFN